MNVFISILLKKGEKNHVFSLRPYKGLAYLCWKSEFQMLILGDLFYLLRPLLLWTLAYSLYKAVPSFLQEKRFLANLGNHCTATSQQSSETGLTQVKFWWCWNKPNLIFKDFPLSNNHFLTNIPVCWLRSQESSGKDTGFYGDLEKLKKKKASFLLLLRSWNIYFFLNKNHEFWGNI